MGLLLPNTFSSSMDEAAMANPEWYFHAMKRTLPMSDGDDPKEEAIVDGMKCKGNGEDQCRRTVAFFCLSLFVDDPLSREISGTGSPPGGIPSSSLENSEGTFVEYRMRQGMLSWGGFTIGVVGVDFLVSIGACHLNH